MTNVRLFWLSFLQVRERIKFNMAYRLDLDCDNSACPYVAYRTWYAPFLSMPAWRTSVNCIKRRHFLWERRFFSVELRTFMCEGRSIETRTLRGHANVLGTLCVRAWSKTSLRWTGKREKVRTLDTVILFLVSTGTSTGTILVIFLT